MFLKIVLITIAFLYFTLFCTLLILSSNIKRFIEKNLISDEDDQKFEEKTLYITSGQDVKTYKNISNLSDGQRGFFVKDNTVFYFIKSSGHPDMGTRIDPDTLTYGGYEYVFYTTTDMVTFVNYTDQFAAVFDDERLVVYLVVDGIDYDEAVELSDELLANQDIEFIHNDPPVIEVPGAE